MTANPSSRRRGRTALALLLAGCTSVLSVTASAQSSAPEQHQRTGTLLVANQASASATIVDLASGTATHLPVGNGPHEARISEDGRIGVVTIYGAQQPGNQLAVIDLAQREVVRTIDLGEYRRPHDLAFLPNEPRTVVVTSEAAGRVVLVDVEAGLVRDAAETRAEGSHMLALTADGRRLFTANVGSGSVSEISLSPPGFVREIAVAPRTEGIAVAPGGDQLWVGSNTDATATVLDTGTGAVVERLTGFDFPYRIAFSADGRVVAVCDARVGRLHLFDAATRKPLRVVENLGNPRGVTLSTDGATAFVTLGPEGEALVVDAGSGQIVQRVAVGTHPDGIAFSPHPAGSGS